MKLFSKRNENLTLMVTAIVVSGLYTQFTGET